MITDKEIETIYDLISDFDLFQESVLKKSKIQLSDKVYIEFCMDNTVDINIEEARHIIPADDFYAIFKDLLTQKKSDDKHRLRRLEEIEIRKRATELTKVNDSVFKAESEFCESLIWARDTATGRPSYSKMLFKLITVFRNGNSLIFEGVLYESEKEFIDKYLSKLYGFQSIDRELK